jgi:hypothetical protein
MQEEASEFAAFVGIDWADRKHDVCLQVPGTATPEASVLEHRPTVIDAWARHHHEPRFIDSARRVRPAQVAVQSSARSPSHSIGRAAELCCHASTLGSVPGDISSVQRYRVNLRARQRPSGSTRG